MWLFLYWNRYYAGDASVKTLWGRYPEIGTGNIGYSFCWEMGIETLPAAEAQPGPETWGSSCSPSPVEAPTHLF